MRLSYEFGTQVIEFEVIYRDKKNLTIEVEAPNIITAIAPIGTAEEIVLSMVKKKSVWIVQKLFEIREVEYRKREKQYVNGESFIYLGRNYSLQIELQTNLDKAYTKLIRGKFCVYSPTKDEQIIKEALEEWFKEKAKEKIVPISNEFAQKMGVTFKAISFTIFRIGNFSAIIAIVPGLFQSRYDLYALKRFIIKFTLTLGTFFSFSAFQYIYNLC